MILNAAALGWLTGGGIFLIIIGLVVFLYLAFRTWLRPEEFKRSDCLLLLASAFVTSAGVLMLLLGTLAL